jgi:glutathione S-transferase
VPGLVLHDNPLSSNALKVRFLLAELGLPYERRTVPLSRPRPAALLALNPVGGIPVLEDDGFAVSESHAILRYLAGRQGRDDLHPTAPRERAVVEEFLDRFATGIRAAFFRHETPALGYSRDKGGFGAVPPDPAAAAVAERDLQPTLRLLEGLVGADAAVLGRFTIADCALAPVLFRTTRTGLDLSAYPRLTALRAALTSRPGFLAADPVG